MKETEEVKISFSKRIIMKYTFTEAFLIPVQLLVQVTFSKQEHQQLPKRGQKVWRAGDLRYSLTHLPASIINLMTVPPFST